MRTLFDLALKQNKAHSYNNAQELNTSKRISNAQGLLNAMRLIISYRVCIRPTSAALAAPIAFMSCKLKRLIKLRLDAIN